MSYTSNDYTSNITITTSVTDLVEIDATAPSTGCPCRALVSYFVPFSAGTNGGDIDTWVLDSNGIMYASNSTHLTASVDDGTAVSDYSSDTFSNSEDVTFTLEAYAKNTGNKAITETTTAGRINYFKVLFLPSD